MIYFIRRHDGHIKIGTTECLAQRFKQLRKEYGDFEVLKVIGGGWRQERALHHRFAALRLPNGRCRSNGSPIMSEWFHPGDELVEFISNCAVDMFGDQVDQEAVPLPQKATLRSRLPALIGKRMVDEGRRITVRQIADDTGIALPTLSKWVRGRIVSFREETAERLCRYFGCEIGELLYIEWETPERVP